MFSLKANLLTTGFGRHIKTACRHFESINSTIFALSTNVKNTGSAIAVIRLAGPETLNVIEHLTKGKAHVYRENPRKAVLQNIYDINCELIDKGMLLWFPKPKSYTGDDMCEFHIHGSQAVISKLLQVLAQFKGCRPAREGEFTKRALTNGKLNLIEAEGIRDIIHAKTDSQRRRALNALVGTLEEQFGEWRTQLIKYMAHLEAYIDFSEDELIDESVMQRLKGDLQKMKLKIEEHVKRTKQKSNLIRDGITICILGLPNVGKSSLINKLCEKDVSITSQISGTTRDVVETWLDFAGYSVCIADTAGIKDLKAHNIDMVEREGIKRAIQRAKECNIVILVVDSVKCEESKKSAIIPEYLIKVIQDRTEQDILLVANKIDLLPNGIRSDSLSRAISRICNKAKNWNGISYLSCTSGEGVEQFSHLLKKKIEEFCGDPNSESLFGNERHMAHLEAAIQHLSQVMQTIDIDLAIAASHLRQASYQLACLTGKITTDDVLDVIFQDFCIGK